MHRDDSGNGKTFRTIENRGFSLIELIVTVAILAIVGGIIAAFMLSSTRVYQSADSEVNLQYEAQIAMNQIKNYVMEANEGITSNGNQYLIDSNRNDDFIEDVLTWDETEQAIYYEQIKNPQSSKETLVEKTKLVDYVDDFSMDFSKADDENKVAISLKMACGEKEYKTATTVNLRNFVLADAKEKDDEEQGEGEEVSTVKSVTVQSTKTVLLPGKSQPFTAEVVGTYYPSQSVIWSVSGASSSSTFIQSTGVLEIGADETAETLNVTATSVQNPSVSGSLNVNIHHNALTITPEMVWLGVQGGVADPDENSNNEAAFTAALSSEKLSLVNVGWISSNLTYNNGTGETKNITLSDKESAGNFTVSAQIVDADAGETISSNDAVVHVVVIKVQNDAKDIVTSLKSGGKARVVIDGMEDIPAGGLTVADDLSQIKKGSSNKFYIYDTRDVLTFKNLTKAYSGAWECDVLFEENLNFWDWFWNPLFQNSHSTSIGIYQGGTTFPKTDSNGNRFDYGFSIYKMGITYSWW